MTRSAHLGNRSLYLVAALKKVDPLFRADPFRRLKKTFAMRHAVCPKFASIEDVRQGERTTALVGSH